MCLFLHSKLLPSDMVPLHNRSMQVLCSVYCKLSDKRITLYRYHIYLECSALTVLRNVRGTSSEVREPVQVHRLRILIFKGLLNL